VRNVFQKNGILGHGSFRDDNVLNASTIYSIKIRCNCHFTNEEAGVREQRNAMATKFTV
jgi:hypothetical protein